MNDITKYVNRLFNEWMEHGKIIIGVDFDSTISPYPTIDNDEGIVRCINLIKQAKHTGAYTIVYTCCDPGRYDDILGFCKNNGIEMDGINKNPIKLPFGHNTKPYCNIYLDDRSGFNEAMNILEQAMYLVRAENESKNILLQQF